MAFILLMFAICKYTKPFYWEHLKSLVFLTHQDYRGRKIFPSNPYSSFHVVATSLTTTLFLSSEEGDVNG